MDMVKSIMAQANLPISFWGLTAAHILNQVPSKSIPSTSYELWTGRKPNLDDLRAWGSTTYVFIGEDNSGRVTEIESRNAIFLESNFSYLEGATEDFHFYEMEGLENNSTDPVTKEGGLV
ncbi:hypothetical protein Dimus_037914 [Dionaea muscipula]